jgi:hypothetical protein
VLSIDYGVEALNVNALDEVPDSTWFLNRRRVPGDPRPRHFSVDEITRGASAPGDEPVPPLTVVKTKDIGSTPGFVVTDARGVRYLIKLDGKGAIGLATSTELVASRLAWATGWRVPSLVLVDVQPEDIRWQPGLSRDDRFGDPEPYTAAMHQRVLDDAPREAGKIRILASRWLTGKSLGSFAYNGRRLDDPNDHYAHENRRDVRGFGVFTAWINDVDTLQNNTLDFYEGKPDLGHVVHYQQDVGGAFGTWAAAIEPGWMGHEGYLDLDRVMTAIGTLGLYPRSWETEGYRRAREEAIRRWPALGGFEAAHFDARAWRPATQNPAFDRLTERDRYWAAKQLIAFRADEVRAAVAAGRYDAETTERLFAVLWERRRRIADAYLRRVAAFDYFRITNGALCFDDLFYVAGLDGPSRRSAREGKRELPIGWSGTVGCVVPPARSGYRVIALSAQRGGDRRATVRVHLVADRGGLRVVGVER